MSRLLFLVSFAVLAGCSPYRAIEALADDAKEQIAQEYLQRLAKGDQTLMTELDPSLRSDKTVTQFAAMTRAFPTEPLTITNLVGYQFFKSTGVNRYNLTYQFGYGSRWVLANVAWDEPANGSRRIVGMSVHAMNQSLQAANAFSFKRAGVNHFFFLTAAVIIPVFCIATIFACTRTPNLRRKWLWIVFILFGLVSFSFNWTTGQVGVAPITILLLGASVMAGSVYSPWIISIAIPAGAILFWIKRARMRPAGPPALPSGDPNPQGPGVG